MAFLTQAMMALILTFAEADEPTWNCNRGGTWATCEPGKVIVGTCSGKSGQSCKTQCTDPSQKISAFAYLCDDITNEAQDPQQDGPNFIPPQAISPSAMAPTNDTATLDAAAERTESLAVSTKHHLRGSAVIGDVPPPPTPIKWVCGMNGDDITCPFDPITKITGVVVGMCGSGEQRGCIVDSGKGHYGCTHGKGPVVHSIGCDTSFNVTIDEDSCYEECSDKQEFKTCQAGYVAVGACSSLEEAHCGRTGACAQYPRTFSSLRCCKVYKPKWQIPDGTWKLAGSVGGGGTISQTLAEGVSTTDTSQVTKTWSQSLTIAVTTGFSFMGFSMSTTVSHETSKSVADMISHATTHELTNTCEASCAPRKDASGQYMPIFLYQWHMDFKRSYGSTVMSPTTTLETCNYYCVYSVNEAPPPCPLGACADPDCTTCTPGWNVTA